MTGQGARVGVIDSGWDDSHSLPGVRPELGRSFGKDGVAGENVCDRVGHGTACAGLIHRVASGAEIVPIRVFDEDKHTSIPALLHAIEWAVEKEFDILNLSLGTTNEEGKPYLYKLCEAARRKNVVIVAAMHHGEMDSFPAVFDNVISVGSLMDLQGPLDYLYRPGERMEVLAKRGEHDVLWLDGEQRGISGVSFGAPNISGLLALLVERYGRLSLDRTRDLLDRFALEEADLQEKTDSEQKTDPEEKPDPVTNQEDAAK